MKTIIHSRNKTVGLILCFLLAATTLMAQNIQVRGSVKDPSGESIIGASILVKGTSNGTITDIDGNYTLGNVAVGSSIDVSYIGYTAQSKTVTANGVLDFVLSEDSEILDEVVVVGYGTTKKSGISGAVSSVKADELPTAASASVGAMLRGRSAGMNITQNSANPGGALNIQIRGGLSGMQPLIVIDGVPQAPTSNVKSGTIYGNVDKDGNSMKDGGMINLNPNDIETIDILKDASAAAIYGSDASGGVILITTKRGKTGKPNISYSGSVAMQFIKDKPDFLNARDFMIEQNKLFDELGRGSEKKHSAEKIANFVGDGTDWMDEVTRVGVVNEHNLSVSAGNDHTKYLFSLSYYDHQGVAKNNSMNRITGRLNLDQTISNTLKAGVNSTYSQIKYKDIPLGDSRQEKSALIYSAMTFNPTVPVYDENGEYSANPDRDIYPNPVSLLDVTDQTVSKDLFVSGYLEYKPIKELTIRGTAGVDIKDVQADQYIPTTTKYGFSKDGEASKQNAKSQMNLVNVIANYANIFNDVHDISVMAGFEYKKSSWEGMGIVASQFPYDGALFNNIGASEQEKPTISSYKGSNEMASFLARLNYSLAAKYILTFNIRVDGSSNFSEEHQWGAFPGVSLAWRMNEEKWLNSVDWLSNLKLRVGVGQTGNAGNLTGINTYYTIVNNAFAPGGSMVNGVAMSKIGNDKLKWETLTDYNVGIDFGFFRNRLSGTIDIYQRERKDVILSKQLMSYHEIKTIDYNSAAVYRARGIDIGVSSVNFDTKNFGWTTDVNFSYYRNHTTKRDPEFIPAIYQEYVETWNNIYGYRTNGLIQEGDSYAHLPNSRPGAILYQDVNGYQTDASGERVRGNHSQYIHSGKVDDVLDDADIVKLANSTPIPFSINNTFRYKRWDANVYIYGSLNGWKINDVKYQSVYGIQDMTYGINALSDVRNRWSPENPTGTMPGVAEASSSIDPAKSDFFLEKAWYLRLDNVSLGYTLPASAFKNRINSVRVYAAARNIAVFTPYNGMDPETGNGIGAYPNQFSFAIGLDIKF